MQSIVLNTLKAVSVFLRNAFRLVLFLFPRDKKCYHFGLQLHIFFSMHVNLYTYRSTLKFYFITISVFSIMVYNFSKQIFPS